MEYGRGKRSGGEATATLLMVRTTAQQKYWYEEEEDGRRGPPHSVGHRKVLRLGIDWLHPSPWPSCHRGPITHPEPGSEPSPALRV
jgi:hypothetical protein